ncbi:hypothetical protein BDR26DRAFT_850275 [Obelidium mucronatum]|nr:hypothetical protein BDR26DRAFT_850275 [Obelidium mucronatum]
MSAAEVPNLKELSEKWLYAMYEEQRQLTVMTNIAGHSRTAGVYKRAFDELCKYPLAISSLRELVVVKGIGPGIIKTLELKLEAHLRQGREEAPNRAQPTQNAQLPRNLSIPRDKDVVDAVDPHPSKKRRRTNAEYVPKYRSGAWSILVTLNGAKGYMTKHEIIKMGQEHADMPLDAPMNGSYYSGWSSMANLLEKELVMKYGSPPRFILSEEGVALVERMLASLNGNKAIESQNDDGGIDVLDQAPSVSNWPLGTQALTSTVSALSNSSSSGSSFISTVPSVLRRTQSNLSTVSASEPLDDMPVHNLTLPAGSFDIVLVLDNREVKNGKSRDFFKNGLAEKNIKFVNRSLDLGDVTWIARPKCVGDYHGDEEIMLEYILERKTLDDLVSSIKDGRFKEQKFRLSDCGIPNVIYLVEEVNTESAAVFGYEGVYTAITQTQVENGFFVKKTYSAEDSLAYLVSMTNFLKQIYRDKTLVFESSRKLEKSVKSQGTTIYSISFALFCQRTSKTKNFCLGDVWIRQLLTIPGMSSEKACFFARTYKTGASFFKALVRCSNDAEREKLIQDAGGEGRKAIGAALGKKMLSVFWRSELSTIPFRDS